MITAILLALVAYIAFVLFLAYRIREEHPLLHILLIVFAVTLSLLLSSSLINHEECVSYSATESTNFAYNDTGYLANTTTVYEQGTYCYAPYVNGAVSTFFKSSTWALRIFVFYLIGYVVYLGFGLVKDKMGGE